MRSTSKAPSMRPAVHSFNKLRMRLGIAAALSTMLVVAFPAFSSADPLGSVSLFKAGLRSGALVPTVTSGPDGNVWFVDSKEASGIPAFGRITPAGTITEYVSGTNLSGLKEGSNPVSIVSGPGGEKYLWFTDRGSTPAIGKIDSANPEVVVEECSAGLNPGSVPEGITVGPDGNLWFTDGGTTPAIGKLDPTNCAIEEFSTGLNEGSKPRGIVAGPDGNLWFTDGGTTRAIAKINPTSHAIQEFATGENSEPGGTNAPVGPWGIAAGADGNVWFTENGSNTTEGRSETGKAIGRITSSGTITYFSTGLISSSKPAGLTTSPGGYLWFTDGSGMTETQGIAFSGAAGGQEFEVCDEAAFKCAKFKYTTITNTTTRTTTKNAIKAAYETVYGAGTIGALSNPATTCGGTCSFSVPFSQEGKLVATNVGQTACKVVTAGGTCSTSTSENGVPQAIGRISTAGTITRYPINGLYSINGPAYGPGGNVWFSVGVQTLSQIGKFGIEPPLTLKVKCGGTGSGSVAPVNCGESTEKASGEEVVLTATEAEGSEFTGWTGCTSTEGNKCKVKISGFSNIEVEASFKEEGFTNRRTLSLTKEGYGAVKSKPKGVACGNTCSSATASLYKNTTVLLSAKAGTGAKFSSFEGCAKEVKIGELEATCEVPLTEDKAIKATFTAAPKAIVNPQSLTVSKVDNGKKTGYGTVKASGLACEADCTSTTVPYFGGEKSPPAKKEKAPALVTLTALASAGSEFAGWTGCESEPEGKCVVSMGKAQSVAAEFLALPKNTLTLTKSGYGAVKSKPKGIACANTCEEAVASLASDTTVLLSAKAGTGAKLTGFEGCAKEVKIGELEGTCEVSMSSAKSIKATFTAAPKAIVNPQKLTLSKAGSGYGTVKAAGLTCETACTSTTVPYFGGEKSPPAKKEKAPYLVVLKAISAPGSQAVVWSGCDEEKEGNCIVSMGEAQSVTATFDELK